MFLRRAVLCFALLSLLAVPTVRAQVTTADVVGTVTDSTKGVIPGAEVTVTNLDTQTSRSTVTNATGEYVFSLLPIGRYSVRVETSGFKAFTVPVLTLASGDRARVNAVMEIGGVNETVEVEGTAAVLQTDSSTVGTLMTSSAVQNLPVLGRNLNTLAQLAVGANEGSPDAMTSGTRPDDRRPTATISVGAHAEGQVAYLIDGMDNVDRQVGTQIVRPSAEAIAEFRVHTNLYPAEVGKTAGGVMNYITKSGTNSLHGSLYEYFRNDVMDAREFFSLKKGKYRLNQFGGSVGGPIIKSKTFFFGDYEQSRERKGVPYTGTEPTPEMIAGNFSGVAAIYDPLTTRPDPANPGKYVRDRFPNDTIPANRIDKVAKNFLSLYPTPNRPGRSGNYSSSFVRSQDYGTLDARLDHQFSEKRMFYARYSYNDTTTYVPGGFACTSDGICPGGYTGSNTFPGPSYQRAQSVVLSYVHVFRPNLLLELKEGYTRYASRTLTLNYGKNIATQFGLPGANHDQYSSGLPDISPSGYDVFGDGNYMPIVNFNNIFQQSASVTWTRNNHTFKFGGSVVRRHFTLLQATAPRGSYTFDARATDNGNAVGGNSIASMMMGYVSALNFNQAFVWPGYRTWENNAYVQDDWRALGWLTLNMGLRYDFYTPLSEVRGRISNFDPVTAKILVPGKDGVSKYAGVENDWKDIGPRFGFAATLRGGMVVRGGYGIVFTNMTNCCGGGRVMNAPFVYSSTYTQDPIHPTATFAQGIPGAVPIDPNNPTGSISLTARDFKNQYVQGISFMVQKDFGGAVASIGYGGALTRHASGGPNYNQPDPGPGAVTPRRPYYKLLPNVGGITTLGSMGRINYHSLQATLERRFAKGFGFNTNYTYAHAIVRGVGGQIMSNWHIESGNSPLDVTHRWTVSGNYELPFGKNLTGLKNKLAGGWQLSGVGVYQTGLAFGITNASARANTGSGDRPDMVGSGKLDNPTIQKWFDTSAFVPQALYTAGNTPLNPLHGPPQRNVNVSLSKRFTVQEGRSLDFRMESFNITNTANFRSPSGALGAGSFGTVTRTSGTPRQVQFALKFVF